MESETLKPQPAKEVLTTHLLGRISEAKVGLNTSYNYTRETLGYFRNRE
jgi:hypothetical protein